MHINFGTNRRNKSALNPPTKNLLSFHSMFNSTTELKGKLETVWWILFPPSTLPHTQQSIQRFKQHVVVVVSKGAKLCLVTLWRRSMFSAAACLVSWSPVCWSCHPFASVFRISYLKEKKGGETACELNSLFLSSLSPPTGSLRYRARAGR